MKTVRLFDLHVCAFIGSSLASALKGHHGIFSLNGLDCKPGRRFFWEPRVENKYEIEEEKRGRH